MLPTCGNYSWIPLEWMPVVKVKPVSARRKGCHWGSTSPNTHSSPIPTITQRQLIWASPMPIAETVEFAKISAYCSSMKKALKYFRFSINSKETWVFTDVSIIEMPHWSVSKTLCLVVCMVQFPNAFIKVKSLKEQEQNPREVARKPLERSPLCCDKS